MINTAGLEGAEAVRVLTAGRLSAEDVGRDVQGLALAPSERARLAVIPAVAGLATALVVGWWMWATDGPLGWTPVVFAVALVVAGTALVELPHATTAGLRFVEKKREELTPSFERLPLGITSLPVVDAMAIIAIEGRPAMNGELTALKNVIR
jgi:ABC-type tungstate transport system substrate-binding protein